MSIASQPAPWLRPKSLLTVVLAAAALAGCPKPHHGTDTPVVALDVIQNSDVPPICQKDEDCYGLSKSPCRKGLCGADGLCVFNPVADATPCSLGDGCVIGESCLAGVCVGGSSRPPCTFVECGVDACGNACGDCDLGYECTAGQCLEVVCGGVTWQGCCTADQDVRWCDDGELFELACAGAGQPDMKQCGWASSKGHYDCGDDGAPSGDESSPYLCEDESCPPDPCGDKECGFACGEACGECPETQECVTGACVELPPTPDVLDVSEADVDEEDEVVGPEDDLNGEVGEEILEDASIPDVALDVTDAGSDSEEVDVPAPPDAGDAEVGPGDGAGGETDVMEQDTSEEEVVDL